MDMCSFPTHSFLCNCLPFVWVGVCVYVCIMWIICLFVNVNINMIQISHINIPKSCAHAHIHTILLCIRRHTESCNECINYDSIALRALYRYYAVNEKFQKSANCFAHNRNRNVKRNSSLVSSHIKQSKEFVFFCSRYWRELSINFVRFDSIVLSELFHLLFVAYVARLPPAVLRSHRSSAQFDCKIDPNRRLFIQ